MVKVNEFMSENVVWRCETEKNFFPIKTLRVNKSSLGSPERDAHAAMLKKLWNKKAYLKQKKAKLEKVAWKSL